jgi:hypothetical protein
MTTTKRPQAPGPVTLTPGPKAGTWTACDGRFTITTYRPGRGATQDEREHSGALDVVDTHGADVLGHPGTNTVRVWEREDAARSISRVLRIEWARADQRWADRQAKAGART